VEDDLKTYDIGPLDDPVLRTLAIALIYIAFAFAAHITALLLLAYWNHFANVVLFDLKW
jgi:hypothetical protein